MKVILKLLASASVFIYCTGTVASCGIQIDFNDHVMPPVIPDEPEPDGGDLIQFPNYITLAEISAQVNLENNYETIDHLDVALDNLDINGVQNLDAELKSESNDDAIVSVTVHENWILTDEVNYFELQDVIKIPNILRTADLIVATNHIKDQKTLSDVQEALNEIVPQFGGLLSLEAKILSDSQKDVVVLITVAEDYVIDGQDLFKLVSALQGEVEDLTVETVELLKQYMLASKELWVDGEVWGAHAAMDWIELYGDPEVFILNKVNEPKKGNEILIHRSSSDEVGKPDVTVKIVYSRAVLRSNGAGYRFEIEEHEAVVTYLKP